MKWYGIILLTVSILGFPAAVQAASPPEYINYQGVLRDASGQALDGTYAMVFRFYDAGTGGALLFTDSHTGVVVDGGLFHVHVGAGAPSAGVYGSVAAIFANEAEVYLEIQVGTDTPMTPRIRIVSSAYALNSGNLAGHAPNYFLDVSPTTQSKAGGLIIDNPEPASFGLMVFGPAGGAHLKDSDASGYSHVGYGDTGIEAFGNARGGYFKDLNQTGYANVGTGDRGIEAYGDEMGGRFTSWPGTTTYVAFEDIGIWTQGNHAGGIFSDADQSGEAYLGYGDTGIEGAGNARGGYFRDLNQTGYANVGTGDRGIEASGDEMGGRFTSWPGTTTYVAFEDIGIWTQGNHAGGIFSDADHTGQAYLGYGDIGIDASGTGMGGIFSDDDGTSEAKLAWGTTGAWAAGTLTGGYFEDLDGTGYANVGTGDWGLQAYGGTATAGGGIYGEDLSSGTFGRLGYGTTSTSGNGTKNFVQNHPHNPNQVIVYAAPEGNEIATYTRGTARLSAGEARIELDESFRWVTNPDIGLTAYVTPLDECNGLYVDLLTTEELVVRELGEGDSDVSFDYFVWGLRIGFEEIPIIDEKRHDAYLPRIDAKVKVYDRVPGLRRHNALERFKAMQVARGRSPHVDLSAAHALREAIGVYDPQIHGRDRSETLPTPAADSPEDTGSAEDRNRSGEPAHRRGRHAGPTEILTDDEPPTAVKPSADYPASETIELGDVMVLDVERHGYLRRASRAADGALFGIAASDARLVDEEWRVELVESRYTQVKADASYGAILPGDLLVSSPTPGHVMRAIAPLPGTIVGKAAEPLEDGIGLIDVLVMLR